MGKKKKRKSWRLEIKNRPDSKLVFWGLGIEKAIYII